MILEEFSSYTNRQFSFTTDTEPGTPGAHSATEQRSGRHWETLGPAVPVGAAPHHSAGTEPL